jgi:transcription elongation factor GreA
MLIYNNLNDYKVILVYWRSITGSALILSCNIKGENRMNEMKKHVMTYEGVKKLEEELENLKSVKRKEITEKIKVALSFGDLSENSEYDEAKNEQAFLEGRILQLENKLKNTSVVDESEIPADIVGVGSVVKVKDYNFNEDVEYFIVGSAEADPLENKISNESPVGSGLLGKKVGDIVEISVPDGISKYEILGIRRA